MVRCSKCGKTTKSKTGKSWVNSTCGKCARPPKRKIDPNIKRTIVRLHSNPVDFYLDLYTLNELKFMKN